LRRHKVAVVALATMALLAVGCTSSSTSSGGSSSSGTSAGAPINVGVVGSYGGTFASTIGPAQLASQAWADSVNAAGGLNGHKIDLIVMNDQGNPATSLTDVKALAEQDHVIAIVGEETTNPLPWGPYIQSTGIPVIGGSSIDPAFLTNPDFFSVGASFLAQFYGIAATARKNGGELGNLYCAESPVCAATQKLFTAFGQTMGLAVPYSSPVAQSAPDFTAECQGLKNSGVQSYTPALAEATVTRVAAQCRQQGLSAKIVLSNLANSTFAGNSALDGTEIVDPSFPFFDQSIPAMKAFHDAIAKYAPSLGSSGEPLNSYAVNAWASGKLFEAAVNAAGTGQVTATSVKKGLYALKNVTLGGLTPPLTFTPGKASPPACYFTYAIEDGKFTTPNGLKPSCAPAAALAQGAAAIGE
jgi:branched-chain amino acid transport system substrate-binding protein